MASSPLGGVQEIATFWAVVHHILSREINVSDRTWQLLSYDHLCENPMSSIRDIAELYSLEFDEDLVFRTGKASDLSERDAGSIRRDAISASEQWRSLLTKREQILVIETVKRFELGKIGDLVLG